METSEARSNLENWLEIAAHSSVYSEYDELCSEAYKVLGHDEYDQIYKKWASGYVYCSDGMYRKR